MDGIIAYILSKKYTNDTVIGMGAIKGAACQVQSINKVNKTTTITLEWEDNLGTSHTQSFDIEDGLNGVSVTGATIKPDGHLELTLSNGTTIDCGKVLPQYDTMPPASSTNEGQILQYIGTTTSSYTNGYFYQCINDGGVYKWVEKLVQDSYTKIQIGDLLNLPDNTKNVVENIVDINSKLDDKENIFRYNVIPTADVSISGAIIQYIGTTDATYTNGYYYQCVESPVGSGTYIWVQKNVQPNNGGGGGDGVVDGYYKSADQLFYEDSAFLNPIAGEDNTIYVDLNTNGLYRYDGTIFIKVSSSAESIQVTILPTADVTQLDKIYQYIGTTDVNYTKGYFYRCILDGSVYKWVNIATQDSYTKAEIGDITDLPDNTKNVVENISDLDNNKENIFRYAHSVDIPTASVTNVGTIIQYIGTTTADYVSGFFYQSQLDTDTSTYKWVNIEVQPASGTSAVESVNNKTGVVVLDAEDIGLQVSTMPTADIDHLNQIVQYIGATSITYINGYWYKCVYDSVGGTYSWEQTNVQPHITVDNALSDTSENPVQNKVITVPLQALQGSMADKANKVSGATVNNFAGLDANGDLIDSGINKDIVPSGASSSNQLVTANDISTLSDKANKVTSATNGDIATLDANGDLTDSGFSKDIIPNTATTSNKLVTNSDLPTELNDLSDDVVITNPQPSQILAYNGTSEKWENKTGQETIGGIVFKGSILFANLPTTGMTNGDAYDIKDAFTTDSRFEEGTGIECGAGTDVVWVESESKWNILTPAGVYSFNGRTGAVLPATSDYDADQVDYDNTASGLTATDVQAAIDEVASEKADKVSSATNGHLAGLDTNGNLTDSGVVADNVIEKVTTATGLLKDDGTVDTTSYAPSANAYLVGDTAETTIDDADYFPFYDTSATGKRKTLFSSIVNKLKNTFATLVTGTFTAGNLVSLDSSGNIADSNISSNDIRKTTTLSNITSSNVIFKISGFGLNTGSLFVIRARGGENILFALGNSSQDVAISYGYSAFRVSGTSAYKINAMTYDYANNELYVNLENYSILSIIQISGTTKYNLTITSVNSIPTTDIYEIPIQNLNSKIDKVSATQNDIAIFDANGGVADSNVSIINAKVEANGTSGSHINLNDYKTAGTYFWNPLDVTTTDNAPSGINQSNSLLVVSLRGVSTGSVVELTQTFYHRNSQGIYVRYCYSSNNWTTWKKLSYSNEVATIAPTPASGLTESDIVDAVNSATATNANAPSLYGVQKYSNEKTVRRVLNGANIPSGTSMTATGIGTWTDKAIDQITSADEADWWYDAAFVVPVYYMLTSDTSIVTGKTYYTRSGSGTEQDPYVYTAVGSPSAGSLSTYYEQYSDDVDISIKFDPSGDTTTLGGYIFDSTTGKICIKFGNSITVATARIAVDITYTRNEVG